jgi:hypothetical protein
MNAAFESGHGFSSIQGIQKMPRRWTTFTPPTTMIVAVRFCTFLGDSEYVIVMQFTGLHDKNGKEP